MNLDDCTVYVFIRQDLPIAQQLVQSCHAVLKMPCRYISPEGHPFMVVIGMPNAKGLEKVRKKLVENSVLHHVWTDTDIDSFPTAIATEPLTVEQKAILSNYRLWNEANCCRSSVGSEHRSSSPEVAGSNPADSSIRG